MRGCERTADGVLVRFDDPEPGLLGDLIGQLIALIGGETRTVGTSSKDPFERWERDFSSDPEDELFEDDDPAVRRLFPNAIPHDPEKSYEFRRFTMGAQRDTKVADAKIVLEDLAAVTRGGSCQIVDENLSAWLKTLNALRLTLAARQGITDESSAQEAAERPDHDPRAGLFLVYSWLGWVQESLLEAL